MSPKPPYRKTVFHYPFDGRPKPLVRHGLFAFAPEIYFKLSGISMQGAFAAMGLEPQYRRLQRSLEGKTKLATGLKAVADLFEQNAPDNFEDLKKALAGDAAALCRLEKLTSFESLFLGMQLSAETYEPRHWFLILLEQVGTSALLQVHAGDIPGAARSIAEHPMLHHLLWPEALAAFEQAPNERVLSPILASMTLEAHLAWIAAWDWSLAQLAGTESSSFTCLIPSNEQPGKNPTSLFYAELQRKLGANSIGGVLATPSGSLSGVEQWTLNRWSAGTHLPDFKSLSKLLQAHGLDGPNEILWPQFTCSKHLHLLGYLGQLFAGHANQAECDKGQSMWPWPLYPFGYPSFEAWAGVRYPHWLAVFAEQSKDLPALVSA